MSSEKGYIYILTNKSFKNDWVKIGYATDPEARRRQLSNTSLPYDFEIYATYEVSPNQSLDKVLHHLIKTLNPSLRLTSNREFFIMKPEAAYDMLECMARIHGTQDKLKGPEYWMNVSKNGEVKEEKKEADASAPSAPMVYDEAYHLDSVNDELANLYQDLKKQVMSLGDIDVKPLKIYIAFKHGKRNVCDVEFFSKHLRVFINLEDGQLNDPDNRAVSVKNVGHHGNGDYAFDLKDEKNINYLMGLIRQSYDAHL